MNKPKFNRIWRILVVLGVTISFVSSIIVAIGLWNTPATYQKNQKSEIERIISSVEHALNNNSVSELSKLAENNAIEIDIKTSKKKENFKTLNDKSDINLSAKLNRNAVNYETVYQVKTTNETYDVWLVVYNVMPQKLFDDIVTNFIFASLFILTIIIVLIIILY